VWKEEEKFSKAHPLNSKIKDKDIFLHATSMKRFLAIQQTGFLLKNPPQKNFSISQVGVCFEKYEDGKYCGADAKGVIDLTMNGYCQTTCRADQSTEGVILQAFGKDLLKIGCAIYADWNKRTPRIRNKEGKAVDVDYSSNVLSIVVDGDVPVESLTIMKKVPFKD